MLRVFASSILRFKISRASLRLLLQSFMGNDGVVLSASNRI